MTDIRDEEKLSAATHHRPCAGMWYLLCAVLLAATLRCLYPYFEPLLSRDAIVLLTMVRHSLEVGPAADYEYFLPPALFRIIKSCSACGIDDIAAGRAANIIFGVLLLPVCYRLFRVVGIDQKWSGRGVLLLACNPVLVKYSADILRESGYLLFITTSLLLLLEAVRHRRWWIYAVLAGGSGAMALMFRYESLEFVLACLFLVVVFWRCDEKRGKALIVSLVALASFGIGWAFWGYMMTNSTVFYSFWWMRLEFWLNRWGILC